jgi:hypothetical protein
MRVLKAVTGPVGVVAGAAAGCGVLLFVNPNNPDSWLPRCPFNAITGLQCPACGATRMAHALVHGDLAAAWHFNALMLIAGLPLLGWLWLRWFRAARRNEPTPPPPKAVGIAVVVGGLSWMVVRNFVGI